MTIRDVTRSVDFDVEFLGFFAGMDGIRHAGFSAKAKVNRKDWNLDWNVALEAGGWLVGETVTLEIEVAVQEARSGRPGRCCLTRRGSARRVEPIERAAGEVEAATACLMCPRRSR